MVEAKEDSTNQKSQPSSTSSVTVSINVSDLYSFRPEDVVLEICEEHYSNLAYIQIANREVYIDFLPMPGVKKDGKMILKGTRIYMSHAAAQTLAEKLTNLLEEVYEKGGIETYTPRQIKDVEASS